jgi:pimeloyl-ACP methyl ester carboxylesterase
MRGTNTRKAVRVLAGAVVILVGVVILFVAVKSCDHTPVIRGADGAPLPGSIASLERMQLGGVDQAVLIRGESTKNPILLFLHSGPGMPEMSLAHAFQRDIERDFVVVHWDQRGSGKSYDAGLAAPESLRISRLLEDTRELVDLLHVRFGPQPVVVLGHSFGSYLGLLFAWRYPDRVAAYVGVGQVVNTEREKALGDAFVQRCMRARGDTQAAAEYAARRDAIREDWLFRCGGELRGATSFLPLLWLGLRAPEYTLRDALNLGRGVHFTHKHLVYDVIDGALGNAVTRLEVPATFFVGRYDYNTPSELVVEYASRLIAPRKSVVWFEDSAHFPFLEETAKFAHELRRVKASLQP